MSDAPSSRDGNFQRAALPIVSMGVLAIGLLVVLGSAGQTLGYDFDAYRDAAERVLNGETLYDPTTDVAGGHAVFLYPPPFVLGFLPFALVFEELARSSWVVLLIAAFVAGALILPVRREVQWAVVILGGLSWPLLYSVKLGQVGTILFFLFAAGLRWMDRPVVLGLSLAAGAVVKLQPAALIGWALVTRRWRASAVALIAMVGLSLVATLLTGPGAWGDYLSLLQSVNDPVTTPHNFTPGAVVYQLGLRVEVATIVQWANVALVVALVGWAWFRMDSVPSYLATVVGSQLVSPLLWDHYALLLLLPAAWLLERGRLWTISIVLATSLPLALLAPPIAYPIAFWAMLAVVLVEGERDARRSAAHSSFAAISA